MAGVTDHMIWAPIDKDGNIYQTPTPDNTSKPTRGTNELGKDAFLQLLVAQMKYQDPLNPTSDTEWISQMATFSTLEEMQNMNTTMGNSQALSLVGKTVIINSDDVLVGGKVDYVVMQKGKAYLAINDELYSIDDLDTVASEEYLDKLKEDGKLDSDKTDKNDTDKTDTDKDKTETDKTEADKDKDKTDAQKLLDSVREVSDKLDTVSASMENAAKALSDAASAVSGPGTYSMAGPTYAADRYAGSPVNRPEDTAGSTERKPEQSVEGSEEKKPEDTGTEEKTEDTTQGSTENKAEGTEGKVPDETESAENAADSGAVEPDGTEAGGTNPDVPEVIEE